MFSFTSRKKTIEVCKHLARVCDLTTPNMAAPSCEDRVEDRHNRSIPTLICPWEQNNPRVDESAFVLTKDLSDIGIGIVSSQPIRATELLVGLWPDEQVADEPWFFLGDVKRIAPLGGGFWIMGVALTEFANQEHQDALGPLRSLAERLRVPPPVSTEPLRAT
jgi:hypothetical protein